MAVNVGSFTKSTAAASVDQAVTGVGFTPKALILWTAGTTTAGGFVDGYTYAIGLTAGASSSGSISAASQDNQGTSNCSKRSAAKALTIVQWGEALLAECDLKSFDADGFTLTWTTNDGNAYIINYMALGGPNLSNAKVVDWTLGAATGNRSVTGVGFQPDCVLHLGANAATVPESSATAQVMIGAMTSGAQWTCGGRATDNQADTNTTLHGHTARTIQLQTTGIWWDYYASYVSMNADGWTVNVGDTANYANKHVFSLALKGGSYYLGALTATTSGTAPVDQAFTGFGFAPEGLLFAHINSSTADYNSTSSPFSWSHSASDGTNERAALIEDDSGAATSNTAAYAASNKALIVDGGTPNQSLNATATVKSLDANGITLTWATTPNIGYKLYTFGFAGGAAASGNPYYAYAQQ